MISQIIGVSDSIKDDRTLNDVFTYLIEEVGELATEVNIVTGYSTKVQGKDSIVGEAVDAIICLVDLIRRYNPEITEKELIQICDKKLSKWKTKKEEK